MFLCFQKKVENVQHFYTNFNTIAYLNLAATSQPNESKNDFVTCKQHNCESSALTQNGKSCSCHLLYIA